MPVILLGEETALWLDPSISDSAELLPLLTPYPAEGMVREAVTLQACLI